MDIKPSTSKSLKKSPNVPKHKKLSSPKKSKMASNSQNTIVGMFKRQREMSIQPSIMGASANPAFVSSATKSPLAKRAKVVSNYASSADNENVQEKEVWPIQSEKRRGTEKLSHSKRKSSSSKISKNNNLDKNGSDTAHSVSASEAIPIPQKSKSVSESTIEVENPHQILKAAPRYDLPSDCTHMERGSPDSSIHSADSAYATQAGKGEAAEEPDDNTQGPDGEIVYRVPYYLENFLLVLDSVLSDDFYVDLFDDADLKAINSFKILTEDAQKLYVRLFSRKFRWVLKGKIVYPKISDDLSDLFKELVESGLIMDESKMDDLEEILKALPAPEVKSLAKTLKLNSNTVREEIIETILQHSRKQNISSFFGQRAGCTASMITKKAKSMLGKSYKLNKEMRYVFIRVTMLFAIYKTQGDEDENAGGQQLLFQMLTSNIGRVTYPKYTISRSSKIFLDRTSLLSYGRALQCEADMYEAVESKDFEKAIQIYRNAKQSAAEILKDKQALEHHNTLPEFLRVYTALSVYVRVISMGVEALQSKKSFTEAVEQLEWLLNIDKYHQNSLGRWYDRLALNLDFHLKKPAEALDVIQRALAEPRVRTGRRLSLWQRAQKICHSPSCKKLKHRWHEFAQDPMSFVQESPKTVIQCQRMSAMGPTDAGAWLIKSSGDGDSTVETTYLRRVEDVVLAHYSDNGYPEGIHGEGGTFKCLFGLFLWDVIFLEGIPDVFYTPYQLQPLDLGSDQFYNQRQVPMDNRLREIKNASIEDLELMVQDVWSKHEDTVCSAVDWGRFDSIDHVCGLVRCFGGKAISGILERMAVNLRLTTGGVPDLVVWNPDTQAVKVVEVKGPNDRLSTKQILWIDYLVNLGVDAEVCHVEAVGTKRLLKSS